MGKKIVSILPEEMRGLMFISSILGFGKSTLATDADLKPNLVLYDFDKNEGVIHSEKVALYKNIREVSPNPLERGKLFLEEIKSFPENKYKVVILDNIRLLEDSLLAVVKANPGYYAKLYGAPSQEHVSRDKFGASRGIANKLISDTVLNPLYEKGVQLIIATSHAKQLYLNGIAQPGKYKIQGSAEWQSISILTLILVNGDHFPIPSAMVRKEALPEIEEKENFSPEEIEAIMRGEISHRKVTRKLPRRMPIATFQYIRKYLYNPADLLNPAPGEELKEEEIEPFREQLSDSQMAIYKLALENAGREENTLDEITQSANNHTEIKEFVKEQAGKKTPVAILNEVKKRYEANGVSMADIMEWSK